MSDDKKPRSTLTLGKPRQTTGEPLSPAKRWVYTPSTAKASPAPETSNRFYARDHAAHAHRRYEEPRLTRETVPGSLNPYGHITPTLDLDELGDTHAGTEIVLDDVNMDAVFLSLLAPHERALHKAWSKIENSAQMTTKSFRYTHDLNTLRKSDRLPQLEGDFICAISAIKYEQGWTLVRGFKAGKSSWEFNDVGTRLLTTGEVADALRTWARFAEKQTGKAVADGPLADAMVITGRTKIPFAASQRQEDHTPDPVFDYDFDTFTPLRPIG